MQTGSSGTLIGWKSGQTTFVPLWDRMEGAWLRTQKRSVDFQRKEEQRSILDNGQAWFARAVIYVDSLLERIQMN
jgi:hypothetical protein